MSLVAFSLRDAENFAGGSVALPRGRLLDLGVLFDGTTRVATEDYHAINALQALPWLDAEVLDADAKIGKDTRVFSVYDDLTLDELHQLPEAEGIPVSWSKDRTIAAIQATNRGEPVEQVAAVPPSQGEQMASAQHIADDPALHKDAPQNTTEGA